MSLHNTANLQPKNIFFRLNRRFAKKRELQEELLGLANDMLDDEPLWQELDEDDRVEDRNAVEDLIQEILIDQAA